MPARPAAPPRPLVGISTDFYAPKNAHPHVRLNAAYFDAVLAAGGLPVVIPPFRKEHFAEIDTLLDTVCGLVMVGGLDLDPRRNGQQLTNTVQPMHPRREDADRYLVGKATERRLPLLAIGSSMQLLNVHLGGTLFLHLPTDYPKAIPHFDPSGGPHRHMVNVEARSTLEDIFGAQEHRVNSLHHQAVNQLGRRLRVGARSPDGVIEAIETTDETWFCIGTQWHPECETASALDRQLFDNLIEWANKYDPSEALAAVA
jgi:putative glutamine amidotransferase